MSEYNFTPMELDALKEISNIGAGNAATSLSIMLNEKIDINVPAVNIIKIDSIYEDLAEKEVYAVIVKVVGDILGNVLIVLDKKDANAVISKMLGSRVSEISEVELSVLGEIGNIISAGFINSMSEFTKLNVKTSVPAIAHDIFSAVIGCAVVDSGQYSEYILDIETIFKAKKELDAIIDFYYIPTPGSLEKILSSIEIN